MYPTTSFTIHHLFGEQGYHYFKPPTSSSSYAFSFHDLTEININWKLFFVIEYRLISKKGEGTFSEVLEAQSIKNNKHVAIKCMKANFYNIEKVSKKAFSVFIENSFVNNQQINIYRIYFTIYLFNFLTNINQIIIIG